MTDTEFIAEFEKQYGRTLSVTELRWLTVEKPSLLRLISIAKRGTNDGD